MKAIAIVADLLFTAKIQAAARAAGVEPSFPRSRQQVEEAVGDGPIDLVFVDLEARWTDAIDAIRQVKAHTARPSPLVVAFGSHVDTAKLQAARDAGADRVMSRSSFVKELGSLFGG